MKEFQEEFFIEWCIEERGAFYYVCYRYARMMRDHSFVRWIRNEWIKSTRDT